MVILGALVPHPPGMMEGIGKPEDLAQVLVDLERFEVVPDV